jgi:hypothetical protein
MASMRKMASGALSPGLAATFFPESAADTVFVPLAAPGGAASGGEGFAFDLGFFSGNEKILAGIGGKKLQ